MFHLKLSLVTKTRFVAYKNLNNFHFDGIFVFSSNFGRNLQNHKTGFQWIWLATVFEQGGVLCRRGRAAASGAATRLAMQLLAAVPRSDVLIRCQYNAARIKPRAAVENFFFP